MIAIFVYKVKGFYFLNKKNMLNHFYIIKQFCAIGISLGKVNAKDISMIMQNEYQAFLGYTDSRKIIFFKPNIEITLQFKDFSMSEVESIIVKLDNEICGKYSLDFLMNEGFTEYNKHLKNKLGIIKYDYYGRKLYLRKTKNSIEYFAAGFELNEWKESGFSWEENNNKIIAKERTKSQLTFEKIYKFYETIW